MGWEDPLEEGMATHSSILAWRIPWTEKPDGLRSMELQRVGHNWATKHSTGGHRHPWAQRVQTTVRPVLALPPPGSSLLTAAWDHEPWLVSVGSSVPLVGPSWLLASGFPTCLSIPHHGVSQFRVYVCVSVYFVPTGSAASPVEPWLISPHMDTLHGLLTYKAASWVVPKSTGCIKNGPTSCTTCLTLVPTTQRPRWGTSLCGWWFCKLQPLAKGDSLHSEALLCVWGSSPPWHSYWLSRTLCSPRLP